MPTPDKVEPRTVLISSRIDELGSSRRAAFRAVHDEGWIPLLYETEPLAWLAAQRHARRKGQQPVQHVMQDNEIERLTMNSLLNTADHFIGIYGTSLGEPSPQLSGLRPIEYEFVRFLVGHVLGNENANEERLADMFRSNPSPAGFRAARDKLRRAVRSIYDESSDYHKVFRKRMALYLKKPPSDVSPPSSMYAIINKLRRAVPGEQICFFTSEFEQVASGAVVYCRPSSHLYVKIRLQIQQWRLNGDLPNTSRPQGGEFSFEVVSREHVGAVLHVVRSIFYEGYNVRKLSLGMNEQAERVMHVTVKPYLHARGDLREQLNTHYGCEVRDCPNPHAVKPLSGDVAIRQLEMIVADRPGMLARALAALALLDMQVLEIRMEDAEHSGGPGRGPRNHVWVTFEESRGSEVKKDKSMLHDFQLPDDRQFKLDFIAADLASQPGFYSVILTNMASNASRAQS